MVRRLLEDPTNQIDERVDDCCYREDTENRVTDDRHHSTIPVINLCGQPW